MKNKILIALLIFFTGCDISQPDKNEYDPFVCLKHPENRKYMPEENITIGFNYKVNPNTIKGVSAIESENETVLPVESNEKNVVIPAPLPPESTIIISIAQSLKSIDNKPLMIGDGFSEKKETLEFEIKTGPKLAEVIETIPENTKSATVGVLFDSEIKPDFQKIEPQPYDLMKFDNWIVFSYKNPVNSILLKDVLSVKRDKTLDEVLVTLPQDNPSPGELKFSYTVSDNSISVSIKDESSVAAKLENQTTICPQSCNFSLRDLKPDTDYVFTLSVFTTTEIKKEVLRFKTEPEKPHIIISEIMHSPLKEPQKNWEFVEIYNNGAMDFDLTNCFIDDNNDSKGIDPLDPVQIDAEMILKPGETALITGNQASFGDIDTLWLIVDDTTIADGGLTGNETVQIICEREGVKVLEANADPKTVNTKKGYSANFDSDGHGCSSKVEGGTPGKYIECLDQDSAVVCPFGR